MSTPKPISGMNANKVATVFRAAIMAILAVFMMLPSADAAPQQTTKPGSKIVLTFRNIPAEDKSNVDGEYYISYDDGTLSLPHLSGRIRAVGKTARQIEDMVRAKYIEEKIYSQPIVSAQVGDPKEIEDLNKRYIQITGNVASKKNLPYRPGITLIEALIECGDITDHGSRHIQVTRKGVTRTYDYFSAHDRSIPLSPNDVIHVPQRGIIEGRPSKIGP